MAKGKHSKIANKIAHETPEGELGEDHIRALATTVSCLAMILDNPGEPILPADGTMPGWMESQTKEMLTQFLEVSSEALAMVKMIVRGEV